MVNIYNEKPTTSLISQLTVERFLALNPTLNKPFLFLGDINLHHPAWNPEVHNSSTVASSLITYLENAKAELLIDSAVIEEFGGTFHRSNSKRTSIIDITYQAGFQQLKWGNWRYGESTGSDHELIIFETALPSSTSNNSQAKSSLHPRFNLKKADWNLFNTIVLEEKSRHQIQMDTAITTNNIECVASTIQVVIQKAAEISIPHLRPSSKSKPWWTEELTYLRREFHKLRRIQKMHPCPTIDQDARLARNKYFHCIQKVKKLHWFEFLASAKEKMIYRAYNYSNPNNYQPQTIPTLRYQSSTNDEEVIASCHSEKCHALSQALFPQSTVPMVDNLMPTDIIPDPIINRSFSHSYGCKWEWPELTVEEIKNAVPNKSTAPGRDQLDWTIIKAAISVIPDFFYQAYSYLFTCGQHPSQWKQAIGIIIPKRNKKDYSAPKAYRPISLLPCLSKLLERIYANRLAYMANSTDHLLHPSQMGGRKQRSTLDAALLLQNFVEKNTKSRKIVSTVFLDILGAFDRLKPDALIQVLWKLQLPVSFISWFASFLKGRTI